MGNPVDAEYTLGKKETQCPQFLKLLVASALVMHFAQANFTDEIGATKSFVIQGFNSVSNGIAEMNKGQDCTMLALSRSPTIGCTQK